MDNFQKFYKNFSSFLNELHHKNSYTKERIINILYFSDKHLSANEIQAIFQERFKEKISMVAIYDLLNFLKEYKLSNSYNENGINKFELNLKTEHNHMICQKCGKVINFYDDKIKQRQEMICKDSGFKLLSQNFELFGICKECQNDNDRQKALSFK